MGINEKLAQFQALPQEVRTAALKEAMQSISKPSVSQTIHSSLVGGALVSIVGFTIINAIVYIVGLFA